MKKSGFTVIELGFILAVVAILLVAFFKARSLVFGSQTQEVHDAVKDFGEAIAKFRERHGFLPGDMPAATIMIAGVAAGSCSAKANGNGNHRIELDEMPCVTYHLFRDGFLRTPEIALRISGKTLKLRAIAREMSPVSSFPAATRNVIEIWNVPCEIAQQLDHNGDDGSFATGNIRASVGFCMVGGANDPVGIVAVAL